MFFTRRYRGFGGRLTGYQLESGPCARRLCYRVFYQALPGFRWPTHRLPVGVWPVCAPLMLAEIPDGAVDSETDAALRPTAVQRQVAVVRLGRAELAATGDAAEQLERRSWAGIRSLGMLFLRPVTWRHTRRRRWPSVRPGLSCTSPLQKDGRRQTVHGRRQLADMTNRQKQVRATTVRSNPESPLCHRR